MYSNPGTQLGTQNKDVTKGFSFVYHGRRINYSQLPLLWSPYRTVRWCPFIATVRDGALMSLETSVI